MATATTVDFRRMTIPERVYHLETEGYVILPDILSGNDVERIKAELESLPMRPSFYSDAPTFASQPPHTYSVACSDLIAYPPMLDFLETLMGDDLVFMHSHYILSHPGQPPLELHTDYQPYGSTYSGWLESCPVRIRVLYYLDDTGTDRAPLRILPRSHICMHADAHPYKRYRAHADEVLIPIEAGSAFVFSVRLFHGVGPNTTQQTRGMLEYDYRPSWARPYQPLEEWAQPPAGEVSRRAEKLLRSRNTLDFRWEFDMKRETRDEPAPGMTPRRWNKA
jgi:ectoine hydroxylase-related dioxygenase (phytanoyl-CoA dioxygenase family)